MTVEELRRFLIAPEIIVVDLVDAALVALRTAVLVEHPTITEFPTYQQSGVLARAAAVLRSAARLRRQLRLYRLAVEHVVAEPARDDFPF